MRTGQAGRVCDLHFAVDPDFEQAAEPVAFSLAGAAQVQVGERLVE